MRAVYVGFEENKLGEHHFFFFFFVFLKQVFFIIIKMDIVLC